jgi:rRNA maturation endonuclease Nob1
LPALVQVQNVAAQIALAFLDLKVHNTATAVTGYQVWCDPQLACAAGYCNPSGLTIGDGPS